MQYILVSIFKGKKSFRRFLYTFSLLTAYLCPSLDFNHFLQGFQIHLLLSIKKTKRSAFKNELVFFIEEKKGKFRFIIFTCKDVFYTEKKKREKEADKQAGSLIIDIRFGSVINRKPVCYGLLFADLYKYLYFKLTEKHLLSWNSSKVANIIVVLSVYAFPYEEHSSDSYL